MPRPIVDAPVPGQSETATFLVIEDDDQLRSTLEISLAGEEYRVVSAHDGRGGIRAGAKDAPHIVLLTCRWPA